jgi:hypothetical protein
LSTTPGLAERGREDIEFGAGQQDWFAVEEHFARGHVGAAGDIGAGDGGRRSIARIRATSSRAERFVLARQIAGHDLGERRLIIDHQGPITACCVARGRWRVWCLVAAGTRRRAAIFNESSHDPYRFAGLQRSSWCSKETDMGVGWAPAVLGTGVDWRSGLVLVIALLVCWGLVVAAAATLFGSPFGGRSHRNGSPRPGRRNE